MEVGGAMSGGHFNHNGYIYYQVHQFADELAHEIEHNTTPHKRDWDGEEWCRDYSDKTLGVLRRIVPMLRKCSALMRAADYLYSDDYGEDSFAREVARIEGWDGEGERQ